MGEYSNVIVAIIAFLSSIITAYINNKYKKAKKKKKLNNRLINHPLHHRMKSYKRRFLIDFKLKNKGKEMILRDLFIKKFELWADALYELAKEIDDYIEDRSFDTDDCLKFKKRNLLYFNETIEKFNAYHYGPEYTLEERMVLEIVIKKFNIWQSDRERFLEEQIIDICNNSIMYPTYERKQIAIFDIYMAVFAMTLNDAMRTAESINGELSGKSFRGQEI